MSWAGVAALLTLAASAPAMKEARMDVETIEYLSTVEDDMFPIALTLAGSGRARLTLATNAGDPANRPAGVFVGSVAESEVTRLAEALTSPSLDGWKPLTIVPGEPIQAFTMRLRDGRVVERGLSASRQAPDALLAAVQMAQSAVAALTRSPARAVSLELSRFAHHHRPERIEAELQLVNRGREPLRLTALDGPEPAAIVVDVVGGTDDEPDQTFVEVKARNVTEQPPATDGTWTLAPGASARIAFVQKVSLRAGKRHVQAILQARLIDPGGERPLAVEIRSPKLAVRL